MIRRPQKPELSEQPRDIYFLTRYTDSLVALGRLDEAVAVYESALEREPYNKELRIAFAKKLALQGERERALGVLTGLETPFPIENEGALFILGSEYVHAGRFQDAKIVFEELNRIAPENIEYLVNLSRRPPQAGKTGSPSENIWSAHWPSNRIPGRQ